MALHVQLNSLKTLNKMSGAIFGPNVTDSIIPPWIPGSLRQNDSGKCKVGDTKFNHLYDPMTIFQRVYFCPILV